MQEKKNFAKLVCIISILCESFLFTKRSGVKAVGICCMFEASLFVTWSFVPPPSGDFTY